MRTSFFNWAKVIVTVFACATFSATGCKTSGWGWPTASWSSWGKKPTTSALVGAKSALPAPPASNFTPTQSPGTPATGTGLASSGGSSGYPSTTSSVSSANPYGAPAANASQPGGYQSSPYGVGQVSGAANSGAQQGAYSSGTQASPYAASQPSGTAATPAGYQGYRTADQRGGAYGAPQGSAAPTGTAAPGYGAPTGSSSNGYGVGNSNGYGSPNNSGASTTAPAGGYGQTATGTSNPYAAAAPGNANGGYAGGSYGDPSAQNLAPAGVNSSSNALRGEGSFASDLRAPGNNAAGGYRPGSTSRAQPIDNTMRSDAGQGVQPATYNNGFGEGSAVPDSRGYSAGDNNSYIPPSGQ